MHVKNSKDNSWDKNVDFNGKIFRASTNFFLPPGKSGVSVNIKHVRQASQLVGEAGRNMAGG